MSYIDGCGFFEHHLLQNGGLPNGSRFTAADIRAIRQHPLEDAPELARSWSTSEPVITRIIRRQTYKAGGQ